MDATAGPDETDSNQGEDIMTAEEHVQATTVATPEENARPVSAATTLSRSSSKRTVRTRKASSSAAKESVLVNVSNCKYEVVRQVAKSLNWKLEEEEDEYDAMVADMAATNVANGAGNTKQFLIHKYSKPRTKEQWNLYWTDTSVSSQRAMRLERFQRLNHFPGMYHLARKGGLGKHLTQLAKLFPSDFGFFPRTWVLPQQWSEFKERVESGKGNRTFIVKPDASCQGKGIFLTRTWENVSPTESLVAQRYLHKPLLIEGYKFDMRIYIIVTSVDPLRMFLFEDGLVRICTQKYVEPRPRNLNSTCMHLTNYAINKDSSNFVFNKASTDPGLGNKRSLKWFWTWFAGQYGEEAKSSFKASMCDMLIKSLISVLPQLQHTYRTCVKHPGPSNCFEILGFDVLVDRKLKPWLIEVNHSPSFSCDSPLDLDIKSRLIERAMRLIGVASSDKRKTRQKLKQDAQSRLYGLKSQKKTTKPKSLTGPESNDIQDSASVASSSSSATGSESVSSSSRRLKPGRQQLDKAKQLNLEVRKRERIEAKQCEDGELTRIYPPASDDLLEYYQPYISAADRLFSRASGADQAGKAGGLSSSRARPLSARTKLLRKAQACGVPVRGGGGNQIEPMPNSDLPKERRLEDQTSSSLVGPNKRVPSSMSMTRTQAPKPMSVSQRISIDLEKYRNRGMQRKSAFNAYLRPRQVQPTQPSYLNMDLSKLEEHYSFS